MKKKAHDSIVLILKESLQKGQQPKLSITSNSMKPLLKKEDQIIIQAIDPTRLQAGDIITVEHGELLLTHRYWGAQQQAEKLVLTTRGDKPFEFDPPIDARHLLGKVVARERHNKKLPLDQGAGRLLNQHLTRVRAFDNQWFIKPPSAGKKFQKLRRIFHRLLYVWTVLVTGVITPIATTPID